MNMIFGLVVLVLAATIVGLIWHIRRRAEERERAEAARAAAFVSGLASAPKPAEVIPVPVIAPLAPTSDIALQKLLFEAAHKAGEAGEPALAIQVYARLLARYPASAFAGPVRAAVEVQKKKLAKG